MLFVYLDEQHTEPLPTKNKIITAAAMRQPYNVWAVGLSYYGKPP
jgi:hypothetical protein